jgi:hypothetical protein
MHGRLPQYRELLNLGSHKISPGQDYGRDRGRLRFKNENDCSRHEEDKANPRRLVSPSSQSFPNRPRPRNLSDLNGTIKNRLSLAAAQLYRLGKIPSALSTATKIVAGSPLLRVFGGLR